jgi:hypothetical protein
VKAHPFVNGFSGIGGNYLADGGFSRVGATLLNWQTGGRRV